MRCLSPKNIPQIHSFSERLPKVSSLNAKIKGTPRIPSYLVSKFAAKECIMQSESWFIYFRDGLVKLKLLVRL